ncbi:MAG: hypothetical protein KBS96_06605 [Lachnospiraceae bacterium]|nr:hypothetical protein [Candidatus Colinaster scatohippi]
MNLTISCVTVKDGVKKAHIRFEEGNCFAEGTIPDCIISKQSGFSDEEVIQLEDYLRANLTDLKRQAARIDPIANMLGLER